MLHHKLVFKLHTKTNQLFLFTTKHKTWWKKWANINPENRLTFSDTICWACFHAWMLRFTLHMISCHLHLWEKEHAWTSMMFTTLLVIKMEYFFLRYNIDTYCFFFGSFITLEQVNDYVMILEYQGEINICKMLCYVTWPFVWSYGRPNVPYSVFFFLLLAYVQWTRVFSGLTVTFVTKTATNVL